MRANASQNEAGTHETKRLVALPEQVEMHLALSECAATEVELLDRLLGPEILALFANVRSSK